MDITLRFLLRQFNMWQKMNGLDQVEVEELPEPQRVKICDLVIRGMSFDKAYQLVVGKIPKKVVDMTERKCYTVL